jgi:hypothetical protein
MVGMMLCHWIFWVRERRGESSFPNLFIKAPIGWFFFLKIKGSLREDQN